MKEVFATPQFTTLCSLESIARNVGSVTLAAEASLGENVVEVEMVGSNVRWHQAGMALSFALSALESLTMVPVPHNGERFIALVLTFKSGEEALRYRMITSHVAEAAWLRESADRLGRLLSLPVALEG